MAFHERQMCERLDVLHERRPPAHTALEGPRRREGRLQRSAVEVADEGGLLAPQVAGPNRRDADAQLVPVALADRALEGAVDVGRVCGDADDRIARAHRRGGRDDAVQDEVRRAAQQHAVLRAHRLGFDAVRDEHLRAAPARHRGELARHREPGAAAPEDPRAIGRVDDRRCVDARRRPVDGEVLAERQRAAGPDPIE